MKLCQVQILFNVKQYLKMINCVVWMLREKRNSHKRRMSHAITFSVQTSKTELTVCRTPRHKSVLGHGAENTRSVDFAIKLLDGIRFAALLR
jgi:hypothetical protein